MPVALQQDKIHVRASITKKKLLCSKLEKRKREREKKSNNNYKTLARVLIMSCFCVHLCVYTCSSSFMYPQKKTWLYSMAWHGLVVYLYIIL